jgi:hypothetical protein
LRLRGVDAREHVALLHHLPIDEVHAQEPAIDLRPDGYVLSA